ncbi:MAG: hypothetical protein DCC67_17405 [Planctomycetota bacterium]|nr:MAG: hypothetical protein DCC67_17405 [Planctomycetota bacterium]
MIDRSFVARAMRGLATFAAVAAVAIAGSTAAVAAPVIVDSHGFEVPWFTTTFNGTGQLEGQTPATFNGTWLRTKGPGASTATVQTTVVNAGVQAVEVNRAAGSDDRWGVPVSGYPSGDNVCIEWDMRVEQTIGAAGTFGPFFGVEAYDDDAATIGLLASLGVDASTGDVLYQAPDTGFFTETGTVVNFGQWNNFMIDLDFATKTASYYFNSTLLGAFGFVDENNIPGGLNEFTDANISALAAAGDPASLALTGKAFYDNFLVSDGVCIPEPTAALSAAVALAALFVRRRAVC